MNREMATDFTDTTDKIKPRRHGDTEKKQWRKNDVNGPKEAGL